MLNRVYEVTGYNGALDMNGIEIGDLFEVLEVQREFPLASEKHGGLTGAVVVKHKGVKIDIRDTLSYQDYWAFITEEEIEGGIVKQFVTDSQYSRVKQYMAENETKTLEQRYDAWILANMHVYELFVEFTLKAIKAGKKVSHWLIVNRLRWEVEIETKGLHDEDKEYKISNDYIAFLARDFHKDYPEHAGYFKLKQMKRV